MLKKLIFILIILVICTGAAFIFYYKSLPLETDEGKIVSIDRNTMELRLNIGYEKEYRFPDKFILTRSTKYMQLINDRFNKTSIEELEIGQFVSIKYNLLNTKVVEVVIKEN